MSSTLRRAVPTTLYRMIAAEWLGPDGTAQEDAVLLWNVPTHNGVWFDFVVLSEAGTLTAICWRRGRRRRTDDWAACFKIKRRGLVRCRPEVEVWSNGERIDKAKYGANFHNDSERNQLRRETPTR